MQAQLASLAFVMMSSLLACEATAQQPTIPEHVAQNHGRPVSIPVVRDLVPIPLDKLADDADLIVVGRLVRAKSYMTSDQTDVYTDYDLHSDRVIVDRGAVIATASTPGRIPPLSVTVFGGELSVNGTPVRVSDTSLKQWREGARLLMFLSKTKEPNRFRLYGGSAGLFEIDSIGRVTSLLNHPYRDNDVRGRTIEQLTQFVIKRPPR